MQIQKINNQNQSFGMRFELSKETKKALEESIGLGLSYQEMTRLPLSESEKLMKERGIIKEPNKLFSWLSDKYKKFGEKTGLLKKEYHFYSEV